MQGNFTVGLVEIFAYLLPGCAALAASVCRFFPADIDTLSQRAWFILAFLGGGFALGHVLTTLSVLVLKLRMSITKRVLKRRSRQEELSFYPRLSKSLRCLFGSSLSPTDEYSICLRLVTENMPNSAREIDRLYALTLFSRNLVLSCVITLLLFLKTSTTTSVIALALSILLIIRYSQLESITGDTVMGAAYVFLSMREASDRQGSSE